MVVVAVAVFRIKKYCFMYILDRVVMILYRDVLTSINIRTVNIFRFGVENVIYF